MQMLIFLDRIGGRLYAANIKCAKGTDRWDLGGQWVGEYVFVVLYVTKNKCVVIFV